MEVGKRVGRPRKVDQSVEQRFERVRLKLLREVERRTSGAMVQKLRGEELNQLLRTVRDNLESLAAMQTSGADGQEIKFVTGIPVSKADLEVEKKSAKGKR